MKILSLLLALLCIKVTQAQVSVYDCQNNTEVTQTIINNAGSVFQQQCVEFPNTQTFLFNGTFDKEIRASTSIKIEPGFTAGPFTSTSAEMKLSIQPESPVDVAVMNNIDLSNALRYEKLELGVSLPEPLKTKLDKFIENELNPALNYPPSTMVNPFLEWELDVEATFTHLASGETKRLDAFFTRDMQRNYTTKYWDATPTNYHMRLRFAPPEVGEWQCIIQIKSNNLLITESAPFNINVVESGKHGYISVHPNKKNFQLDGEVIYPLGQNLPHVEDYQPGVQSNLVDNTEFNNNIDGWQEYINLIDQFGDAGGRFTRIFMAPWAGLIEWEEKGNYFRRMHQAYELDNVLDKMAEHDMYTIFDLLLHSYYMTYSDYDKWAWDWDRHMRCTSTDTCDNGVLSGGRWYPSNTMNPWELDFVIHPYNDNPGNYLEAGQDPKLPHEMFLNESDLTYHEQRTRYYISRYGYSTQIYIWEQLDEPFHMSEDAILGQETPYYDVNHPLHNEVQLALETYIPRMHAYIREHLDHQHQLLGISAVNRFGHDSQISKHDWSIIDPLADCIGLNPYPILPNELVKNSHDDPDYNLLYAENERSFLAAVSVFGNNFRNMNPSGANELPNPFPSPGYSSLKRPVYYSECGEDGLVYSGFAPCQAGTDENIDNMRFGFSGAAGFNKWHYGFGNNYGVWESIVRAEGHMNGSDVKNVIGNNYYLQGRQHEEVIIGAMQPNKGDALEMQYYLRLDKTAAVGYVYNRTVNYRTAGPGANCGSYDPSESNYNIDINIGWQDDGPFKKLKIGDLPNDTEYRIDFYGYPNGNYIFTDYQQTGTNGKFIVEFPDLSKQRALVWFVVTKQATRNLLITDQISTIESVDLEVFPNPTSDIVNIPVDFGEMHLFDAVGNEITLEINRKNEGYFQVNLEKLTKGCYYLKATGKNDIIKIIKI
jgi:Secretion system C-terminal sorting domain